MTSTQNSPVQMKVTRWPIVASSLWTMFVWGTRIRNAVSDDAMSTGEKSLAIMVSVVFLGAAVTLLLMLTRRRIDELRVILPVYAIGTVGWWAFRSVLILVHDHGWGFRIVHIVLGIISSVLAVIAWRATQATRARAAL